MKNKTIKIFTLSKIVKVQNGKRQFRSFWTYMNFKNDNGENERKSVNLKFTEQALKDYEKEDIEQTNFVKFEDFKRGYIITNDVHAPFKYEIVEDENGKKKYPCVYVRHIEGLINVEREHSQDDFCDDTNAIEEEDIPF